MFDDGSLSYSRSIVAMDSTFGLRVNALEKKRLAFSSLVYNALITLMASLVLLIRKNLLHTNATLL